MTFHGHDKLAAETLRQFPRLLVVLRVKDDLRVALAVTHLDKNDPAQITPGVYPTHEAGFLSDVRRAQFTAMICPLHRILIVH
jgi:hypothetical protein